MNKRDKACRNPLHLAIQNDLIKLAEILLDHGADPNAESDLGMTPLHMLSRSWAHEEDVQVLDPLPLISKNDVEENWKYKTIQTPFRLEIPRNQLGLPGNLFEHGANANAQNNHDITPFHKPTRSLTYKEVTQVLDLALLLLKNGAEVNRQDKDNETALHLAIRWQIFKLAMVLLKHGADADAENKDGKTPLRMLSESCSHHKGDLVDHAWLVFEHARLWGNQQDEDNKTSLRQVLGIGEGNTTLRKLLLSSAQIPPWRTIWTLFPCKRFHRGKTAPGNATLMCKRMVK